MMRGVPSRGMKVAQACPNLTGSARKYNFFTYIKAQFDTLKRNSPMWFTSTEDNKKS